MQERDTLLRIAALKAAGNIPDRRFLRPLIQALYDGIESIRHSAAIGLDRLITCVLEQGHNLDGIELPEGSHIMIILRSCQERPVEEDAVIKALEDRAEYVRAKAASLLSRWNNKPARRALMALLKDAARGVRMSAVKSLGEIGDQSVIQALDEVRLTDPDNHLAGRKIVWIGARIEDEWDVYDFPVRQAAEHALGKIKARRLTRLHGRG